MPGNSQDRGRIEESRRGGEMVLVGLRDQMLDQGGSLLRQTGCLTRRGDGIGAKQRRQDGDGKDEGTKESTPHRESA